MDTKNPGMEPCGRRFQWSGPTHYSNVQLLRGHPFQLDLGWAITCKRIRLGPQLTPHLILSVTVAVTGVVSISRCLLRFFRPRFAPASWLFTLRVLSFCLACPYRNYLLGFLPVLLLPVPCWGNCGWQLKLYFARYFFIPSWWSSFLWFYSCPFCSQWQ